MRSECRLARRPVRSGTSQQLRHLIRRLPTVPASAAEWSAFLDLLATTMRSPAVGFVDYSPNLDTSTAPQFLGLDESWLRAYNSHFARINSYMAHGGPKLTSGIVLSDFELCPRHILLKGEFYNDYLKPAGIERCIGACVIADEDGYANLSIMRQDNYGEYTDQELATMRRLMPDLQRAVWFQREWAERRLERDLWKCLVEVDQPLAVTDRQGRILWATQPARRILAKNDGLVDVNGRLAIATSAEADARLSRVIRACDGSRDGGGRWADVSVTRTSGRRPLNVRVTSVPDEVFEWSPSRNAVAVVFIKDPEPNGRTSTEHLRTAWGLTASEAAVSQGIAEGHCIAAIASKRGVAESTVRALVKRVFRKVGVGSQADLLHVIGVES